MIIIRSIALIKNYVSKVSFFYLHLAKNVQLQIFLAV